MVKKKLRNIQPRRKAIFGSSEAATLAAAGIGAAATAAAAALGAKTTKEAAREQATAARTAAQQQARALHEQSEAARQYQLDSQDFIKQQNDESRQIQRDIQMQLQMLTGGQNEIDRMEASKIRVKYGGKKGKRKGIGKRDGNAYFLRGSNNLPFRVTDGGSAIPIGITPEGYDIYELQGNDHEHYHKAQGGKNKTGVGIKFADGEVIEGEGNQNTNSGEKMIVTPYDAFFLSKHNIKGFNPSKSVDAGMNPMQAYAIQEQLKNMFGISDNGKNNITSPVENMYAMGGLYTTPINYMITPDMATNIVAPASVGIAARTLKNGGRHKAAYGRRSLFGQLYDDPPGTKTISAPMIGGVRDDNDGAVIIGNRQYATHRLPTYTDVDLAPLALDTLPKHINANTKGLIPKHKTQSPRNTLGLQLAGAGIGALGNIGGALLTSMGNDRASRYLASGYRDRGNILADAYSKFKTIDDDVINRNDYRADHALAAIQAPISLASGQLSGVDRALAQRMNNVNRNSTSSAAALNREAIANAEAQELRNKIYGADQEQRQKVIQGNAERVTQVAGENANRDIAANQDYTDARLSLLKYNNDIVNERILGAANARAEGLTQSAGAIASSRQANGQIWGNALTNSLGGFANVLTSRAKRQDEFDSALLSSDTGTRVAALARKGTKSEIDNEIAALENMYRGASTDTTRNQYLNYLNTLRRRRGLGSFDGSNYIYG